MAIRSHRESEFSSVLMSNDFENGEYFMPQAKLENMGKIEILYSYLAVCCPLHLHNAIFFLFVC